MKEVEELTRFVPCVIATWFCEFETILDRSVFREVVEAIESKQAKDDKREKKLMGPARQLGHGTWYKAEDERRVKELREKVEKTVKLFKVRCCS